MLYEVITIGVFLHYKDDAPFFTLEAKRLPTFPKKREKEYVIGDDDQKYSGGIERFKRNLHGVNLKESAMIAYVQSGDCSHWSLLINSWIQDLIDNSSNSTLQWTKSDLLKESKNRNNEYYKYHSTNTKTDGTSIVLSYNFV